MILIRNGKTGWLNMSKILSSIHSMAWQALVGKKKNSDQWSLYGYCINTVVAGRCRRVYRQCLIGELSHG